VVDDTGPVITDTDGDGDGFSSDVDCNDADVTIYPGAGEVCDGIDNNCNGEVDEGLLSTWYLDADGDGHGNPDTETEACNEPDGHVAEGGDCNDLDDTVHPDALELCDGFDNDCDGTTDEGDASDVVTWYLDSDGDGFGVDDTTETACDGPAGYALVGGDCDDADPAFHPGASESDCTDENDYNCDGSVGFADTDGDGFAACEDCDDADADVNDDAIETCDSVDNDCDGLVDSDDPDTVGTTVFYGDSDGDGYGGQQYQLDACEAAPGFVGNSDDCDDLDASSYPGASEVCDDADNDCDGDVDEGVGATWYQDSDSDGYGNGSVSSVSCDAPSGYVSNALDCDDFNAATHPGSYEICDSADNDCDGSVDEDAINATTWYVDADGDGYGSSVSSAQACSVPSGHADNDADCDDADGAVHPAASEWCDTVDNDCDGSVDESDAVDAGTWYQDADGDGYGNPNSTGPGCSQPSGFVADDTDCDDSTSAVKPGGTEVCDGLDNNCDGDVDEDGAANAATWYLDNDGDGYGTADTTVTACSMPTGYSALNTDCDDDSSAANPTGTEVVDGVDNDCDGAGYHGVYLASGDTSLAGGEWEFTSFDVSSGATVSVTGSDALEIYVLGAAQVDGTLDLSAQDGEAMRSWSGGAPIGGLGGGGGGGAGANGDHYEGSGPVGAPNAPGAGGGQGGTSHSAGSGGGGGGQAVTGDDGGACGGAYQVFPGGSGGSATSNTISPTLTTGAGGGGGGWGGGYNSTGGAGGGGGGALYLEAESITIAGSIVCSGGDGGGNDSGSCWHGAGGGGGSGGTLWLVGDTISLSGSLDCDGGAGGAANYCTHSGIAGDGGNGAGGVIWLDANTLTVSGAVTPAAYFP
jgi:hypothetical protein